MDASGPPTHGRTPVVILDRRPFDRLALETLCEQTPGVTVAATAANMSEGRRPKK